MPPEENPILQVEATMNALYPDPAASEPSSETPEEPKQAEEPAEETASEGAQDAQDASAEAEPAEDAIEPEEGSETATDSDPDSIDVTSVSQLAEHLQADPAFFEDLTISQKINGEMIDVRIADALATHRKVTAADDYLDEAKQKRTQMLEEVAAQKDQYGEVISTFGTLLKDLKESYQEQYNAIDWNGLKADDPATYAAKKQDFKEMQERLAQMESKGKEAYHQTAKAMREREQKQRIERLPQELNLVHKLLPEWADEEKASQEGKAVAEYLSKAGFTAEQVEAAAYNGRVMAMAVKAMRYDNALGKKTAAKKKVLRIPKVVKPGSRKEPEEKPNSDGKSRAEILYGS